MRKWLDSKELGYPELLEWTGGWKNRPLAVYGFRAGAYTPCPPDATCFMSASDSDGNGFSVALPQPEAKRLAQALRLPDPPSGVVFACGSWNGKIYELDLATTFWESATCVSITVIKLPDLLRWLLREKKRFCTELKAWGAGDILLDSPPRVFLGGKGRKY